MKESPWRLAVQSTSSEPTSTAAFQHGLWTGRLDTHLPQRGIYAIRIAEDEFPARRLMAVQIAQGDQPAEVVDHYIRGADVVASYAPFTRNEVRPQIYWRLLGSASFESSPPGWELIVSVQTGLLHSEPACMIFSELVAEEVWRMGDGESEPFVRVQGEAGHEVDCTRDDGSGVFLVRTSDPRFSFVQMVHPSDFHRTRVAFPAGSGATVRITHQLFPEALEKGVIRRGRVRGWILDRANDLATAAERYQAWLAEPPPLTT